MSERSIISRARLDRLSRRFGRTRPETCIVKRSAGLEDAGGNPLDEVLTTVGVFDCGVDESPAAVLRVAGPTFSGQSAAVLHFLKGVVIQDRDTVEVDGGFTYTVSGSTSGSSFGIETLAIGTRNQ